MGVLDALKSLFGTSGRPQSDGAAVDADGVYYYVACNACGEIIRIRAHRRNDFNREDDGPSALLLRKEVMGSNRCYQMIRTEIWVDSEYQVVSADVTGGSLSNAEAYEAQQAANNAEKNIETES